jgi:hypothetical protein
MESLFRERNLGFGYLKTEENNDKGYIARPTDQRLNLTVIQDYMPNIPSGKTDTSLYNTGSLLGGSPSHADPYLKTKPIK